MKKKIVMGLILCPIFFMSSCGLFKNSEGFNLFSISDDKALGFQVSQEIDSNPKEYPLLDSAKYSTAYKYLYDIRDRILNSGQVKHKDDFAWRLRIVKDDNVQNAFCTPGGYIYVYTGLIKYLGGEDELAGVLAHEIGHADYRHSTRQMTKLYGVQILLDIAAGDLKMIKEVSAGLIGMKFSRTHETEADEASVKYLCSTDYNAAGAAKFFEKIEAMGGGSGPEWLSTHPSPENRIEHFHSATLEMGCKGTQTHKERYQKLINALP